MFVVVKTWKQPTCPLEREWVNRLYVVVRPDSGLKRNELSSHEKT